MRQKVACKKKTCQPEEVLDSEPRDADRLDQREDWVLDRGLAFKVLTFKICLQGQSVLFGSFGLSYHQGQQS